MNLSHVIIYTRNVEEVRNFYEGIGFGVKADYGMWVEFDTGSATLALHEVENPEEESRNLGIFVQVDDVRSLHERFQSMGLEVSGPAVQDFGFRTIQMRDPMGNLIEFGEPVHENH